MVNVVEIPVLPGYSTAPADPVNAVFIPIFTAISLFWVYLPMRDFCRKKNFAACSMIAAVTISNFYQFINAVIWPNDNLSNWFSGIGLCDIENSTRYMATTAVLCSTACFTKNLADVFNTSKHSFFQTTSQKRRKLIIDILFCWLLPIFQIALRYITTLGRFSVVPVYGCYDENDQSWPFVLIYLMWGPIFTLVALYYAILLLHGLRKYRQNISGTLASSGSGMNPRYFVKLAIIATLMVCLWVPAQFFYLYLGWPQGFHAYSWSEIHDPASWDPVFFYHTGMASHLQYNGWSSIAYSFLIFIFFGFNNNAVDTYKEWLVKCGVARIWPTLTEPRKPVQRQGSRTSARGSLSSHLNLVGKAMKYFDGCDTVATAASSQDSHSRKVSLATFTSTINTHKNTPSPDSIPCTIPKPSTPRHTIPRRNVLNTLRTHINLPLPLFNWAHQVTSSSSITDLEAQKLAYFRPTTSQVSTSIWSDANTFFGAVTRDPHCLKTWMSAEKKENKGKENAVVVVRSVERRTNAL